jgi:hypothetical protein
VSDERRREEIGGRGLGKERCQAVKWDRWKSSTEKETRTNYINGHSRDVENSIEDRVIVNEVVVKVVV